MITKLAEAILQSQQTRALSKLDNAPGLVVNHSLGSGKTLTAISAAKKALDNNPGKNVLCIVPASLVDNVWKEIDKHNISIDKNRLEVLSYERAVNNIDALQQKEHSLIIVDEAHRLRNAGTKRAQTLEGLLSQADKRMLLTGTLSYNKLSDAARLINIAANEKVLPDTDKDFTSQFVGTREVTPSFLQRLRGIKPGEEQYLKNTGQLSKALSTYVDRYDSMDDKKEFFPRKKEKNIHVEMDPEQHKFYKFVLDTASPLLGQ